LRSLGGTRAGAAGNIVLYPSWDPRGDHLWCPATATSFSRKKGDRFWTPADWAWAGGLLNALLPALHFGVPISARKFEKFDPEMALAPIEHAHIRNGFIPPTVLRMLRTIERLKSRFSLNLRMLGIGRRNAWQPNL
jgi:acetyl-CoA synthetase